ncbi:MAG TPA: DUF488 domain-containing protein [Acidimicrobiales bacterium]|nr:DUF488 domain-containing protein [Acidimicrobiales bacterium]
MTTIRSVGHGTAEADDLGELLRGAGVTEVVDVRRFPGSRRHPQFSAEAMASWLPEHEVGYQHLEALGGRRKRSADSPNIGVRNDQLRAYADHMATEEFLRGVDELLGVAAEESVAVLCSESVWWRCHRRFLADHLVLVHDVVVEHLFHDGRLTRHEPTPEARRAGDHVVYDVGVAPALFDADA